MKVPISKQLAGNLIVPCIAITGAGFFDLYFAGEKRFDQNVVFIIVFGIPAFVFAWLLLNKKVKFKDPKKVRKADRIFQLPFSSSSSLFVFIIASFFLVGGTAGIVSDKNISGGFPMLMAGLFAIVLLAVAIEHSRIWFSDTWNTDDVMEKVKNASPECLPAYEDGIFSYSDKSFTIQVDNDAMTVRWDEITLIEAYKIDQYIVDSIVIEIHFAETSISINDQTIGHMKFMETASIKLPNFKRDWFTVVVFPTFGENLTTIYKRQTADKNQSSQ